MPDSWTVVPQLSNPTFAADMTITNVGNATTPGRLEIVLLHSPTLTATPHTHWTA